MRQPVSSLTRWVVAGLLAGFATGAIADVGFLYTNGVFRTIAHQNATGINNAGQIVGYNPADGSSFLDTGGTVTTFKMPGKTGTVANGINNAAQIVGDVFSVQNLSSPNQGFLYTGGVFSTIDVPGAFRTSALGINNAGQIVGLFQDNSGYHGFLDTAGAFSTLDVPTGTGLSAASAINNNGQIVGFFNFGLPTVQSFVYAGGTFRTIAVPGAPSTVANGINDAGDIVGTLSGVPEPGSLVLFSVGMLGLALAWRRRFAANLR